MLVLFIVCLMKLLEMYTNNNKMARRSARNAKENCFGLQGMTQKFGMPDESLAKQQDGDRYSMNYFYDVDQACVDQLKEFLHQQSGNNCSSVVLSMALEPQLHARFTTLVYESLSLRATTTLAFSFRNFEIWLTLPVFVRRRGVFKTRPHGNRQIKSDGWWVNCRILARSTSQRRRSN